MKRFLVGLAMYCALPATLAHAQNTVQDFYSPTVQWRQASGWEVTPIHVGLLPNGELFFLNAYNFFENPGNNFVTPEFAIDYMFLMQPTPVSAPLPPSVLIEPLAQPASLRPMFDRVSHTFDLKTLTCSGHGLMADGKVFFAGGPHAIIDLDRYAIGDLSSSVTIDGIAESFTFDPATESWTENPKTVVPGPVTRR